ncbi:MAG: MarR family transcriptional regulator [Gammaproteobacteria bacterium]
MQSFSEALPMRLYRALHAVMPRFRAVFAAHGLTEPQWRVLRVLWEREEVAFRELAQATLVPPPSLVGVIDRLQAAGLVTRRRPARDRRQALVRATARGRTLERAVTPAVEAVYDELRAALPPDIHAGLVAGLDALAALGAPAPSAPAAGEHPTIAEGEQT